ncbi:MAG: hypothetical protein GX825_07260 [Syntrophomonadaceae bacterium]|nr:hypothetical protein [Syntrophomonadaceae bacterium]
MDNQNNKCEKENLIRQLVKVQAQVSIIPDVRHGTPKVSCLDSCIKPSSFCSDKDYYDCGCCDRKCWDYDRCWHNQFHCDYESGYDEYCCENSDYDSVSVSNQKYNYTLTQLICVEIPISIDADVDIKEGITCCGKPEVQSVDDISKKRKQHYIQMI